MCSCVLVDSFALLYHFCSLPSFLLVGANPCIAMKSIIALVFLGLLVGVNAQGSPLSIECGTSTVLSFNTGNGADLAMDGAGDVVIHGDGFVSNPNGVFSRAFQGAFTFADHFVVGLSNSTCDGVFYYDSNFNEFLVRVNGAPVDITVVAPSARSVDAVRSVASTDAISQTATVGDITATVTEEGLMVADSLIMPLSKEVSNVRMILDEDLPVVAFASEGRIAVVRCLEADCSSASLAITELTTEDGRFEISSTGSSLSVATAELTHTFPTMSGSPVADAECNGRNAGTIHNAEGQLFACTAVHSAFSASASLYQWVSLAGPLSSYF